MVIMPLSLTSSDISPYLTLTFILQQKRKVIFDLDEERLGRLKIELVDDTDPGVSSPVEEDESGGRDAPSIATPSVEGSRSLSILLA